MGSAGVSTRRYADVLPEMAEEVGLSKSQVSREEIDAGERLLKKLAERGFSEIDLLVIYVDGVQFGPYHVICAVGVDHQGHKHVLGFREGATENASERSLRHAAIWRKLSFGTQSAHGSRFTERMLTAIETCRQQKRNVFDYVTAAVNAHFHDQPGPSLLPRA